MREKVFGGQWTCAPQWLGIFPDACGRMLDSCGWHRVTKEQGCNDERKARGWVAGISMLLYLGENRSGILAGMAGSESASTPGRAMRTSLVPIVHAVGLSSRPLQE